MVFEKQHQHIYQDNKNISKTFVEKLVDLVFQVGKKITLKMGIFWSY